MPKQSKIRLDLLLVNRHLVPSRHQAQLLITAGRVRVNDRVVDKAGTLVASNTPLTVGQEPTYVSRGGIKLARALAAFRVPVSGRVCLDIGAGSGGFSDCLLQHGAALVYAVDVGYGQFDWQLRQDPRVRLLERTNARYLSWEQLYGGSASGVRRPASGEEMAYGEGPVPVQPADLAVIDVSFISLTKIIPNVLTLLGPSSDVRRPTSDVFPFDILALVKPQFEAGRSQVGKKGVVRSPEVHREVLTRLCAWVEAGEGEAPTSDIRRPTSDVQVAALTYSPLRGPQGNIEFWMHLRRDNTGGAPGNLDEQIAAVVEEAHRTL